MPIGRSLTIFIMDDSPLGLRQVELDNWTGIAVIGPRGSLDEARQIDELETAGVYLLLDDLNPEDGVYKIYVGETEDFSSRGIDRNERLPNWEHFLVFYSKDENLTKAHVRWLELRVFEELRAATGRVILANGNSPPGASLPKPAEASMQTYLSNMLYTLSALGMDFFVRRERRVAAPTPEVLSPVASDIATSQVTPNGTGERFWLPLGGGSLFRASALLTGQRWTLLSGSRIAADATDTLTQKLKELRSSLMGQGILVMRPDGHLETTADIDFGSPTAAAAFVRGYSINGKWEWRRERDDKRFSETLSEIVG